MNKIRLVVFGDSFPAGIQKYPDGQYNSVKNQIDINFVTKLANKYNLEFINYGHAGHSSVSISYDVYKYINTEHRVSDIVLVCWSGFFRTMGWDDNQERFVPMFIKNHDLYTDYMREVVKIYTAIYNTYDLLKSKNSSFWFISSFVDYSKIKLLNELLHNQAQEWIGGNEENSTLIAAAMRKFQSKGDLLKLGSENVSDHKVDRNPDLSKKDLSFFNTCGHPNDRGHNEIVNFLSPYIERKIKDVKEQWLI